MEAKRERLEDTRDGLTLHFSILVALPKRSEDDPPRVEEIDGYVTTGVYPDGRLGEFFVCMAKKGSSELGAAISAMGPLFDAWAKACSVALQYGAPMLSLLGKEVATQYDFGGTVKGVVGVRWCSSPTDLVARWLISKYAPKEEDRKNAFVGRRGLAGQPETEAA